MYRALLATLCALVVTACALTQPHEVTRPLGAPTDARLPAFAKALQATKNVHGTIERQDLALGEIDARMNQKVTLHITIESQGTGSSIAITQKIAPDFVTPVPVTAADDWIRAYKALP